MISALGGEIPVGDPVGDLYRFLRQPEKEFAFGWLPWAFNFGPAPAPGYEQIPWTAWTLPG